MELCDHPDDVAAAHVGHVTIFGRGRRCDICPKNQRGKTQKPRCHRKPQERPSMITAAPKKPLNPSSLMSHCPHLIISHITGSWPQAEPALLLPALPAFPLFPCPPCL